MLRQQNRVAYLFMLPWLIGFFGLTLGPMLASLALSMTRYSLLDAPVWTGFDNYRNMFVADDLFYHSLGLTFAFVLMSVPLKLAFALAVALALNKGIRGLGLYRTIYYIPSLLGGSVAISIVWRKVFDTDGIFNRMLAVFGIKGPSWVSHPDYILYAIVALAIWQFGSSMIIFLAGLKQIPAELYEAAEVDGAGPVRRFVKITLPLLSPVIFFNLVMGIINAFQVFTPAYVLGDGRGGPINSTMFYTLYLYLEGFSYFDMGYASALAWIMLLIIAAFTAVVFATQKYWVFYYGDESGGRGRG